MTTCPSCGGRGHLPAERRVTSGGTRKVLPATDCKRCSGTGQLPDEVHTVSVVGHVLKENTGWRACIGPPPGRYLTSYNTAKEAKAAVEQQIHTASQGGVRWQHLEAGYYQAVMR